MHQYFDQIVNNLINVILTDFKIQKDKKDFYQAQRLIEVLYMPPSLGLFYKLKNQQSKLIELNKYIDELKKLVEEKEPMIKISDMFFVKETHLNVSFIITSKHLASANTSLENKPLSKRENNDQEKLVEKTNTLINLISMRMSNEDNLKEYQSSSLKSSAHVDKFLMIHLNYIVSMASSSQNIEEVLDYSKVLAENFVLNNKIVFQEQADSLQKILIMSVEGQERTNTSDGFFVDQKEYVKLIQNATLLLLEGMANIANEITENNKTKNSLN